MLHLSLHKQGRSKVLKSGGARYNRAVKIGSSPATFCEYLSKTGGARAPLAPPVPAALELIFNGKVEQ